MSATSHETRESGLSAPGTALPPLDALLILIVADMSATLNPRSERKLQRRESVNARTSPASSSTAPGQRQSTGKPQPARWKQAVSHAQAGSLSNQHELEGLDVAAGQGNHANTQGQVGLVLTSSSEEGAGEPFRTECPLSVALRSGSLPLRHVDRDIPVRVVTRRQGRSAF